MTRLFSCLRQKLISLCHLYRDRSACTSVHLCNFTKLYNADWPMQFSHLNFPKIDNGQVQIWKVDNFFTSLNNFSNFTETVNKIKCLYFIAKLKYWSVKNIKDTGIIPTIQKEKVIKLEMIWIIFSANKMYSGIWILCSCIPCIHLRYNVRSVHVLNTYIRIIFFF